MNKARAIEASKKLTSAVKGLRRDLAKASPANQGKIQASIDTFNKVHRKLKADYEALVNAEDELAGLETECVDCEDEADADALALQELGMSPEEETADLDSMEGLEDEGNTMYLPEDESLEDSLDEDGDGVLDGLEQPETLEDLPLDPEMGDLGGLGLEEEDDGLGGLGLEEDGLEDEDDGLASLMSADADIDEDKTDAEMATDQGPDEDLPTEGEDDKVEGDAMDDEEKTNVSSSLLDIAVAAVFTASAALTKILAGEDDEEEDDKTKEGDAEKDEEGDEKPLEASDEEDKDGEAETDDEAPADEDEPAAEETEEDAGDEGADEAEESTPEEAEGEYDDDLSEEELAALKEAGLLGDEGGDEAPTEEAPAEENKASASAKRNGMANRLKASMDRAFAAVNAAKTGGKKTVKAKKVVKAKAPAKKAKPGTKVKAAPTKRTPAKKPAVKASIPEPKHLDFALESFTAKGFQTLFASTKPADRAEFLKLNRGLASTIQASAVNTLDSVKAVGPAIYSAEGRLSTVVVAGVAKTVRKHWFVPAYGQGGTCIGAAWFFHPTVSAGLAAQYEKTMGKKHPLGLPKLKAAFEGAVARKAQNPNLRIANPKIEK